MTLIRHNINMLPNVGLTDNQEEVLRHMRYDEETRIIKSSKALETTLNSLYLGDQHKMSSGAENIFFTNLGNNTNFYPMWGGLKDQSLTANQGPDGFIPPSGRVYTDLSSTKLGGDPLAASSIGYSGPNYFGVSIAGLGITTVSAETLNYQETRLEYRLFVNDKQVYMQELDLSENVYPDTQIEWFFDHPVEIHAGTTIFAEIIKVDIATEADLGVFQVRMGDDGTGRYQATVHNRLFTDKDLELISPYLKYKSMDFSLENTGSTILLKDLSLGSDSFLVPYPVNTVSAIANGTEIKIQVKDGAKVIVESLPISGISINGAMVNSVLSIALTQLNDLFSNTAGFTSSSNSVSTFTMSGNNLTIALQDGQSFTVDVTSLGVDENNFVSSGIVNGSSLDLTMTDSSVVSIDVANMINGSTLPAVANNWYIAYGSNSGNEVTTPTVVASISSQQPFYNGQFLEKGHEFMWTHPTGYDYMIGAWGTPSNTGLTGNDSLLASMWDVGFKYRNILGQISGAESAGTDQVTRMGQTEMGQYDVTNNTILALRYGFDNYMTLWDVSNGEDTLIARSATVLLGDSQVISFAGNRDGALPNLVYREQDWTVVHDFDSSEAGLYNGLEEYTVVRSNIAIAPNEKFMINLDMFGRSHRFGIGYSGASTGVTNAQDTLELPFLYGSGEEIRNLNFDLTPWTLNTGASLYDSNHFWRKGSGINAGMISLRYLQDNTLELWSEDLQELIATANVTQAGLPIHLYHGVNEDMTYALLPVISKQDLDQASQPLLDYAPDVVSQSFSVTEGEAFNIQIALQADSDIVNQFAEVDAPSWAILNQLSGAITGTAPTYTGTSDSYVINCKAANVIGGSTNFQVTINVEELTYTNTKSLKFVTGINSFLGGNAALVTAMERSSNGSGASDAWTLAFWYKQGGDSNGQTLFYFGNNDVANQGHIELKNTSTTRLRLKYGSQNNYLQLTTPVNSLTGNWDHVMVTYDGGTTGVASTELSNYYSRFKIFINGVEQATSNANGGYGWTGSVIGQNYRFGKYLSGNYPRNGLLNQLVIWNSDQSSNISGLYNGGSTQDVSLLQAGTGNMNTAYLQPNHYYEIEDSVTTIQDLAGSAHLVGYNFTSSDLTNDTP